MPQYWRRSRPGLRRRVSERTCRHCKCALIVFNKHNAGFEQLLDKLPAVIREHPNYRRDVSVAGEGEWRFICTSLEDDSREVRVHMTIFNPFDGG